MSYNSDAVDPFAARIPYVDSSAGGRFQPIHRRLKASMRRWERRKTLRALERLSDWVLRDIGVSRADIPRLAEDLIADDPRPASLIRSADHAVQREAAQHHPSRRD